MNLVEKNLEKARCNFMVSLKSILFLLCGLFLSSHAATLDLEFSSERLIDEDLSGTSCMLTTDIDGDRDIDLILSSYKENAVVWYENNGSRPPSFTKYLISQSVTKAGKIFAADLDSDGDTDVIVGSLDGADVIWFENDGESVPGFEQHTIRGNVEGNRVVFVDDLDGDGDNDILSLAYLYLGQPVGNEIVWYENDGTEQPMFAERMISSSLETPHTLSTSDLDADGDVDIVIGSWWERTISWFENDGGDQPGFTMNPLAKPNDRPFSVSVLDLDKDNDMDVLSAYFFSGTIRWYENDGESNPTFAEHTIPSLVEDLGSAVPVDLDGDDDFDILSLSRSMELLLWFENDGAVRPDFTLHIISETAGDDARSPSATDLDGDGDLDLLLLKEHSIVWHENLSPLRSVVDAAHWNIYD